MKEIAARKDIKKEREEEDGYLSLSLSFSVKVEIWEHLLDACATITKSLTQSQTQTSGLRSRQSVAKYNRSI